MKARLICLAITLTCCFISNAQISSSSGYLTQLTNAFNPKRYESPPNSSSVFLMTDKTIYRPDEEVWISGYLLRGGISDTAIRSLYLVVSDAYTKKVVLSKRFPIDNGKTSGSFLLPISMIDGRYILTAYSDAYALGRGESIWIQDILVKSLKKSSLKITPFDEQCRRWDDSLSLKYFVYSSQGGIAKGAKVISRIYADSILQFEIPATTNDQGEIYISTSIRKELKDKHWEVLIHGEIDTLSNTIAFPIPPTDLCPSEKIKLSVTNFPDPSFITVRAGALTPDQEYSLFVYNDSALVYTGNFHVDKPHAVIKLPRDSFPDGYLHFALQDAKGDLVDESTLGLFSPSLDISSDSSLYHTRSVARLKIRWARPRGIADSGVISVSCVLGRRLVDQENNITRKFHKAGDPKAYAFFDNKDNLAYGRVLHNGRPLSSAAQLLLLGGVQLKKLETDTLGNFTIKTDDRKSRDEDSLLLAVAGDHPEGYSLKLFDPIKNVNDHLAGYYHPLDDAANAAMEQVFTMQEVQEDRKMLTVAVVRNQFGSDISFMDPCMMLIRNGCHCRDCSIINKDKYKRCKDDSELSLAYIKKIQASSLDNGFVKRDYSQSPKLVFNKLYSTLLWEPFVRLDSAGTEVTIFTNDLEGKFVVNVQGMSTNGPVYGRAEFSVERLPIEVATAPNWQSHK